MKVYKSFTEIDDSWKDGVRDGIDALKHGWNGVARDCAKRAEKDFLSIKDLYVEHYDKDIAEFCQSEINALKGLTYYSLKNPSQDAEYAHNLILRKQLMRRIRRKLKEPLKYTKEHLFWIAFNFGKNSGILGNERPTFLDSMNEYHKCASELENEKYDAVISEVNKNLRECGVGKF